MAKRRLPPLRSLEAFMYTVRLGSARAAANQLSLSPSALSRRIATLEEFIGKKLFTRARQAMQLTDEGAAFHEAVLPHFEALSRAVEGQSENSSVLRLHLGVLPLFGTQRLFPRLAELRRSHPLLHIDIDTGAHIEDRVGDTLDAGIILSRGPASGLHAVRLDHNRVHAIASRDIAEAVGEGSTTILSRGYGACRIESTALPDIWRGRFFNAMDTLILDTFEAAVTPEAALAAPEDLADSAERILDVLETLR